MPPSGGPKLKIVKSGGEEIDLEEGPKKLPVLASQVEELARWLHDTAMQVCDTNPERLRPWDTLEEWMVKRYVDVARQMLKKPPRFFKRVR